MSVSLVGHNSNKPLRTVLYLQGALLRSTTGLELTDAHCQQPLNPFIATSPRIRVRLQLAASVPPTSSSYSHPHHQKRRSLSYESLDSNTTSTSIRASSSGPAHTGAALQSAGEVFQTIPLWSVTATTFASTPSARRLVQQHLLENVTKGSCGFQRITLEPHHLRIAL